LEFSGMKSKDRKRMFTATLQALLSMLLLVGLVAAITIPAVTEQAALAGWVGASDADRASQPVNLPTFEWVEGTELVRGCVVADAFPADRVPSEAVVVTLDGKTSRVPFGIAWAAAKSAPANTYWIVGACR
jgi:hypothetical protein